MIADAAGTIELVAWGILTLAIYLVAGRLADKMATRMEGQPPERIVGLLTDHLLLRVFSWFLRLLRIVVWIFYALILLRSFDISSSLMDSIFDALGFVLDSLRDMFTRTLFSLGEQPISLSFLVTLIFILIAVSLGATAVRRGIRRHLLSRLGLELGLQEALATATGYVFLLLGGLIALDLVGLDLSTLAIIAGALSIGIGFGLQNIANNFISGLILLAERPVKVGDRIEVEGVQGEVTRISARSTIVRTNDNIDIIVPNSQLVSEQVINWSQSDRRIRFNIPVGVAYGTDVQLAMKLMEEAGSEIDEVLKKPAPAARFLEFGDSALELDLRVWTVKRLHTRARLVSDINCAIYRKFTENDISIPFPQREINVKSWPDSPASFVQLDSDASDDAGDDIVY